MEMNIVRPITTRYGLRTPALAAAWVAEAIERIETLSYSWHLLDRW